jgi:hypothetical protein
MSYWLPNRMTCAGFASESASSWSSASAQVCSITPVSGRSSRRRSTPRRGAHRPVDPPDQSRHLVQTSDGRLGPERWLYVKTQKPAPRRNATAPMTIAASALFPRPSIPARRRPPARA